MPTIPWYQSAILRQQIVQLVTAVLLLFGVASDAIDVDQTIGLVFGGVAGLTAVWTFVTRLFKPTPPITDEAAVKTVALAKKQGGFVRLAFVGFLLALGLMGGTLLQGCAGSGTRAAYTQAQNPADLAYVLAEHYAALIEQAANLRQKPGTPAAAVAAMQRADTLAQPAVRALRPLRDAYVASKSATSEAELQAAINRAVTAIAELVRSINTAKGAA